MADKEKEAAPPAQEAPEGGKKGKGIMGFLPLILTIVLMPALAFAMTKFVLVPQLQSMVGTPVHAAEAHGDGHGEEDGHAEDDAHAEDDSHGDGHGASDDGHGEAAAKPPANGEYTFAVDKVIVNVRQTRAQRFLMVSLVLTSKDSKFPENAELQNHRLKDLVMGALRTKTIDDIEQPGAQNLIRTELKSIINNTLSAGGKKPFVDELYFTEFAIQ